jgi:hypothetical protein
MADQDSALRVEQLTALEHVDELADVAFAERRES